MQITRKNLCHIFQGYIFLNLKKSKKSKKNRKNLKKSLKNPKNLRKKHEKIFKKISKITKFFRKISLNLCHFFSSYLPLGCAYLRRMTLTQVIGSS